MAGPFKVIIDLGACPVPIVWMAHDHAAIELDQGIELRAQTIRELRLWFKKALADIERVGKVKDESES